MKITFTEASWADYLWLQENNKKLLKRVNLLVAESLLWQGKVDETLALISPNDCLLWLI